LGNIGVINPYEAARKRGEKGRERKKSLREKY